MTSTAHYFKLPLLLVIIAFASCTFAQSYEKADKIAQKMPSSATKSCASFGDYMSTQNGLSEVEALRVAYIWIAKNVGYNKNEELDFNLSCSNDSIANLILKKRKANAMGFAELFSKLSKRIGVDAYTITGYTKQGGEVSTKGHAWNAVKLADGRWMLFDPMWGAGTLSKGKFEKNFNDAFFAVAPNEFIKTHMPFDPIWQLQQYPIAAKDFIKESIPQKGVAFVNFEDTIRANELLFPSEQLEARCRRMGWIGNNNECSIAAKKSFEEKIPSLKAKEKYALENRRVNTYNSVVDKVNTIINDYNSFVALKNTFRKKGISAVKMKETLDSCSARLQWAQQNLAKVTFDTEGQRQQLQNLKETVSSLNKQVGVQQSFILSQKEFKQKKKKK